MKKLYLPINFLILLFLISCANENRSGNESFDGLNESTLAQKKINDLGFEVRLMEITSGNGSGRQDISLLLRVKNLRDNLPPIKYNLQNDAEFGERINYFSFGIQRDLKLVLEGDTIACSMHHFVRKYDLAPYLDIVAVFPVKTALFQSKKAVPGTFIYNDRIFNTGPVNMGLSFPPVEPKQG